MFPCRWIPGWTGIGGGLRCVGVRDGVFPFRARRKCASSGDGRAARVKDAGLKFPPTTAGFLLDLLFSAPISFIRRPLTQAKDATHLPPIAISFLGCKPTCWTTKNIRPPMTGGQFWQCQCSLPSIRPSRLLSTPPWAAPAQCRWCGCKRKTNCAGPLKQA